MAVPRENKTVKVPDKIPYHIAIIMDGNGRWAKKRLMPRTMGHRAGMAALKRVVKACVKFNIPILTVYAFSTENWKRPGEEVDYLMKLLVEFVNKELAELHEQNIRINVLGDYLQLPFECQMAIKKALHLTAGNSGMIFNIALNYGARLEIIKAVREIGRLVKEGKISPEDIDERLFADFLFTRGMPDPDLVIRTAGEMRVSNFLLWQIAYSEIWITDKLWPDFTEEDLLKAIDDYSRRERRFGGLIIKEKGEENA
ncbi:Undecaprenyl pyrophosphate synthetase [Thermosyntropha lipolytica DSM 11003]|uniref:Isoprenyl transferase n=1 Tax=Thermosyntropha lipolytica DSM 11003 TaxID=1123382 RepID=A0A1M5KXH6_9FIRM|nr:isoprenyl transferase [Thermosyntropha lipolytica]SHG57209.1 Undecaprenyl pyrophosphate synthetase [Thermosyntropha lipolytica DSM 11003]